MNTPAYIAIGFFTLLAIFATYRLYIQPRLKIRKESLVTLPPEPYRDLEEKEIQILNFLMKHSLVLVPGFIVGSIIMIFISIHAVANGERYGIARDFALLGPVLLVFGVPIAFGEAIQYWRDKKSKVYRVRGKAYKHSGSRHMKLFIGKTHFDIRQENIAEYDELDNLQEVEVSYSPHSKYIWSIK